MATYVIGDVQGCYDELEALLSVINYHDDRDDLWFTGDLVNRGPNSLQVLRLIRSLPNVICVLGNHDLSLLALAYANHPLRHHTLDEILSAPDREELLQWLRNLPLIYTHPKKNYTLVHAGIPPQWTLTAARRHAREVEHKLRGAHFKKLLRHMFGNIPNQWDDHLRGYGRYRYIINAFTRMRFCEKDGTLNFDFKGSIAEAPEGLLPWFEVEPRKTEDEKILFGHWAALEGKVKENNLFPLDTGCVWGRSLTALRLEDEQLFSVECLR